MNDNQLAILALATLLIVFRGYFGFLDVRSGVRTRPSFIFETSLSILAIVVLAAIYWIERARAIAIVSILIAIGGHGYSLYRTGKAKLRWVNAGLESIAGDGLAVVGCVGMLVFSLSYGQAWSMPLTLFMTLYLAGVVYGYIQRRRDDRNLADPEVH